MADEQARRELASVLRELAALLRRSGDSLWAPDSVDSIARVVARAVSRLERGRPLLLLGLRLQFWFIPTGSLQEISIDNGWGQEYCDVADRFDLAYARLRRRR